MTMFLNLPLLLICAVRLTDAFLFPRNTFMKNVKMTWARGGEGTSFAHKSTNEMHTKLHNAPVERNEFVRRSGTAATGILASSMSIFNDPRSSLAATLPSIGVPAPNFELPNSRGGMTSLTGLALNSDKKSWTVLYFYPGAFTSGCTLEARGFQRDLPSYSQLNAQVVGISVDPLEKNAQFCKEEKLDFDLLSDAGGRVSKLYGSSLSIPGFGTFSNRQTYIIDPDGNLRWVFTDVESHVARHSKEVLEKLNELVLTDKGN